MDKAEYGLVRISTKSNGTGSRYGNTSITRTLKTTVTQTLKPVDAFRLTHEPSTPSPPLASEDTRRILLGSVGV